VDVPVDVDAHARGATRGDILLSGSIRIKQNFKSRKVSI